MTLLRSSSVEWWKSSKRVRGAGVVWSVRTGETAAAIKIVQIGLVQVGLVVPPVIHRALVRLIGPYPAERHLVAGQMIAAERALEIGLVDELQPADQVVSRAVDWCRTHLALPQHSMLATRALCRADLGALFGGLGGGS